MSVAVMDAEGRLRGRAGTHGMVVFARSVAKPFQALPLVEEGVAEAYGFEATDLALCCGSHNGEPRHVEAVRDMLARIGLEESTLACGPHAPMHEPIAHALRSAGQEPGRAHNNCSGKHAGMLALARHHGWSLTGYERAEHPVQRRMLEEMARWTGVGTEAIGTAVDGCGVETYAVPLDRLALAYGRLVGEARRRDGAARRVVQAMVEHPEYVAGTNRLCTELMRATDGR
ncbi:MAG TPA: asparaginase, partial [Xanthomonadaceae bacterium]|nr:asparaginase [Xanthomonadaceae bacterium]